MSLALVILAAGKGTRMQSDLPKVLHKIAGAPLITHVVNAALSLNPERIIVVTGHGTQAVETCIKQYKEEKIQIVVQSKQLGTGHAVQQAQQALEDFNGNVIIMYGDTPLLKPQTLSNLKLNLNKSDLSLLGFTTENPGKYGRLIAEGDKLKRIVEFKDASKSEKAIQLCNSGVMAISKVELFKLLSKINNQNASGEFYLTDVVEHAVRDGKSCKVIRCAEEETMGVNTRAELAKAELEYQKFRREDALDQGITMSAPETVHFSFDTIIGRDTIIEQNVVFGPGVRVEEGAQIKAFSHLEGAFIETGCTVGPYARLRTGTKLGKNAKVGNFVEVKESQIGGGTKINHLSYVGDAVIGSNANVGAGTITCNYDGVQKHKTIVGNDAFIGSNTMLVAPVSIGKKAFTASGSVIIENVPDGALALGRSKQINKLGLAIKLLAKLKSMKTK
ncbi:MAG: bifunctional UDP-N-acetylglucosamine diphosphorylase/glucosamine-1-phosphate N-acetyltransferase GlmU [Planktomarina sp.]|nr:bifunctional UDP-N-acetylglucosamine diphosphorylase/glucosamine-1-phosphate N-acetyltransferase GlmU [Planktomarina sp.]